MSRALLVAVLGALSAGACGFGITRPISNVADTGAQVTGVVRNTKAETTGYWYEYGLTTAYGQSSPHRTVSISSPSNGAPTEQWLAGLDENTTYHYRLCARGLDSLGLCGSDLTFTTTMQRDSVNGLGTVFSIPELGYAIGASVFVSSDPGGAPPVTGIAALSPGTLYFRIADAGAATCLRVVGNRAVIGFLFDPSDYGVDDPDVIPRTIFIEDNGATGDRIQFGGLDAPYTSCPDPSTATFPPFFVGGNIPIAPVLTTGDFDVHDHTEPSTRTRG